MTPLSGVTGGLFHPGADTGSQGAGGGLRPLGTLIFLFKLHLMFSKLHRLHS